VILAAPAQQFRLRLLVSLVFLRHGDVGRGHPVFVCEAGRSFVNVDGDKPDQPSRTDDSTCRHEDREEPRRSSRSRFEDAKRSGVLAIPLVSDFSVVLNKLALQAARQIQAIYERITSTESVFLLSIRRAQTR
jgi:hypothetical protein